MAVKSKTAAKPAAPAKGGKGAAPKTEGLAAQFKSVWKEADKAAVRAAFENSTHNSGSWSPPDSEYILEIIEGSSVKSVGKDEKYPLCLLAVKIVGTDGDDSLVGKEYQVPLSLMPLESKNNPGETYTLGGGIIKFCCQEAFDAEVDDPEEGFIKLAEEGVGTQWNARVATNDKGYANHYFNSLVTDEGGGDDE